VYLFSVLIYPCSFKYIWKPKQPNRMKAEKIKTVGKVLSFFARLNVI
jgi:hypothetical protein